MQCTESSGCTFEPGAIVSDDDCEKMLAMHRIPAPFEPVWYQHLIAAQAKPAQPVPCSTIARWWLWFKRHF